MASTSAELASAGPGPEVPSDLTGVPELKRMDQLYQATQSTLADAVTEITSLRSRLESSLVGRERYDDFGKFSNVSREDVDSLFADSLTEVSAARSDTANDYARYKHKTLKGDDFASNSYNRVERAIHSLWASQLKQTDFSKGWYGVWDAPLVRLVYRHDDQMRQLQDQLTNSDLTSDQKQAMIDALKAKQSAEDHTAFEQLVTNYRALLSTLLEVRVAWTAATWRWADLALAMAQVKDDVHDQFQQELRRQVFKDFAAETDSGLKVPDHDTTVEFFNDYPGSPDRLITPFSSLGVDKWCDSTEFPDVMPDSCVLRMKHLGDVSVVNLRPAWPASSKSSQIFPGAPTWYTPGETAPPQP